MGRLDNKVAIVTGAGSGIGRAAAILFAKEGAKVVAADWVAEGGEETVKMIKKAGNEATFIQVDVSQEEDVRKMIKTAVDTYGKLDVLYNNAGVLYDQGPTETITKENFDKTIAVNLWGVLLGMKYAIPEMLKAGGGSIINQASRAADRGCLNLVAYTASKGGVLAMTRVTAREYAPKNIRVNAINPCTTATPMVMAMPDWMKEQFLKEIPMGRFGKPEEIAQVALFLASDDASWVTGHGFVIDGGAEIP